MKNFLWCRQRKNWLRIFAPLLFLVAQLNGPTVAFAREKGQQSDYLRTDTFGNPARWNPCAELKWKLVGAGISDAARETIFSAMAALNEATGLAFTYEEGGALSDFRAPPDNTLVVGLGLKSMDLRVAGTTRVKYRRTTSLSIRISSATVGLNPDIFRRRAHSFSFVTPVLLHELGHAVGLNHVDDPTDIMFAKVVNRTKYQQSDMVKLARIGASRGCNS